MLAAMALSRYRRTGIQVSLNRRAADRDRSHHDDRVARRIAGQKSSKVDGRNHPAASSPRVIRVSVRRDPTAPVIGKLDAIGIIGVPRP
jgi:hypothetical protein